MKTINTPSNDEFLLLKKVSESDSRKKVRKRAEIILNALNGFNFSEIAQFVKSSLKNVYHWIKKWNELGIGAIVTWRQTNWFEKQVKRQKAIEKLVSNSPASLKLPFNTWSIQKISKFFENVVEEYISPTTIFRDLKRLNISYRQVQETFILKPIDYDIKCAVLRFIERFCPSNYRLLYIDEKGPIYAMRYSGHIWSSVPQVRDVRQPTKKKITFLGGYDARNNELKMIPMEGNASTYFCDGLDTLRLEFLTKGYQKLFLILDNAKIHKSKETLQYLDADPAIEYFFLPAYSPELNPIEICFRNYSKELLENASFFSKEDIIERTTVYCEYYSSLRCEIYG